MEREYNIYHDDNNIYPLADELVNCFSEYLKGKGIMLINEDIDKYQIKNKNAIYGEDFRNLQEIVQIVLDKHIK